MPSFIILQTFVFVLLNVKQLNINTYADIDKNQTATEALILNLSENYRESPSFHIRVNPWLKLSTAAKAAQLT
jgi:hypothetical protein